MHDKNEIRYNTITISLNSKINITKQYKQTYFIIITANKVNPCGLKSFEAQVCGF